METILKNDAIKVLATTNSEDLLLTKKDTYFDTYLVYMPKTKSVACSIKLKEGEWKEVGFLPASEYAEMEQRGIKRLVSTVVVEGPDVKMLVAIPEAPTKEDYRKMKTLLSEGKISEMPAYDKRVYDSVFEGMR